MKRLLKVHTRINRLSAFDVNARIGQGNHHPLPVRAFSFL
ncbi:hypothetical protein DET54_11316 [Paenibacillus pabuli]|uniref:Uncharacterized protein n=1 Tax=Paenibacillus pabuli TaxID=1472 RepID=A0A855XVH5_9BACL|nr:hypothetical protein DET56_107352 [Paenibacillus pabuli]PXW06135.1 hypothetical protein DEU73_107352 [Paenibacillus taichungensis]RAI89733.1 hypothetical protein DET54_11316 [Paenibacillus pabuli]